MHCNAMHSRTTILPRIFDPKLVTNRIGMQSTHQEISSLVLIVLPIGPQSFVLKLMRKPSSDEQGKAYPNQNAKCKIPTNSKVDVKILAHLQLTFSIKPHSVSHKALTRTSNKLISRFFKRGHAIGEGISTGYIIQQASTLFYRHPGLSIPTS